MGHRDDLLAGAKRCLYERGYARTTARDIVTASGTNLASIGYHFGSKEALLRAAMSEALEDWATELGRAVAGSQLDSGAGLPDRLEEAVRRVLGTLERHRPLWVASLEIFPQIERSPQLRAKVVAAYEEGRRGLAALAIGEDAVDVFFVLVSGLITQWLVDPRRAPNAADLMRALRATLGSSPTPAISGSE